MKGKVVSRGDATYARGNCDWPLDPVCQSLLDNDSRWLHEILWRIAVKERRPVIFSKYSLKYLAQVACISERKLRSCIEDVYQAKLIGFTTTNLIVIFGVIENHPKLQWKEKYPEKVLMLDPNNSTIPAPYGADTGPIRVKRVTPNPYIEIEREIEIEKQKVSFLHGAGEPASVPAPDDPIYLTYPTIGNPPEWNLCKSHLDKLWELYHSRLDVLGECKKAQLWCWANQAKQKTARGMFRFLVNWFNKATDSGRGWTPKTKEQVREEAAQLRRAIEAKKRPPSEPTSITETLDSMGITNELS